MKAVAITIIMLAAAGFHMELADTPARTATLETLPPRKITMQRHEGTPYYVYADPDGSHIERLVEACWTLGRPRAWRGLRRWAHMLGFGGHFLTKSRRYSTSFRLLREQRIVWARTETAQLAHQHTAETTALVGHLRYAGAGWRTTGDALLANTSAALARERRQAAREEHDHENRFTARTAIPAAA